MMSLEEDARFASMLDDCCQRVRGGEPLERCLTDYPVEYRGELVRLVPVAGLVSLLARDPSPDFQVRLEQQLLASMDVARSGQRTGLIQWIGGFFAAVPLARAAAIALVVLLLLGGGFGVDQAAADSLPDSPLYQVKTVREQIQLALARAPEAQVDVHARQIAQRGVELNLAVQKDKQPKVIEALVTRVETSTGHMVQQALAARARGNPIPARRALVAIRLIDRRLDVIVTQAQPSVRPSLQELQGYFQQQEQRLLRGTP
jgi:hypothetical protein